MTPADEAALRVIWANANHGTDLYSLRKAFALGRASGWQAGVQALAIHKPYGTYNNCRLCGSTWWDGKREEHRFDCVTRTGSPLVTDDQRASVSGGRNADTGQEQRDPVACEVGLKPSGLSGSAPAETQVRPESATTTSKPSVSGERCARCGWERDHDPRCPSPDNKPTDRNAGRDAALPKVVAAFIAPQDSIWQGAMVNVTDDGAWWAKSASSGGGWELQSGPLRAVEAALKGGAR